MSAGVFALVMLAALLHALWNALVKTAADRTATLGLIAAGHVAMGLMLVPFVPLPALAAWPWILASTVIHFAYYYLLNRSYLLGDLSLVYPVARGITPVLVTLGAFLAAGETPRPVALAGVAAVSGGILLLGLQRALPRVGMSAAPDHRRALGVALMTGVTIAAYSLVDGLGVRASGAPMGYVAWLFLGEVFVAAFVLALRGGRVRALSPRARRLALAGGLISAGAYGLVMIAQNFAPLGIVSSLRETSVLFAALIGVIALGERPWRGRLLAAIVVMSGVAMIALA